MNDSTSAKDSFVFWSTPKTAGWMHLDPGVRVAWRHRPNRWRRFWYWALLGWKFTPDSQ